MATSRATEVPSSRDRRTRAVGREGAAIHPAWLAAVPVVLASGLLTLTWVGLGLHREAELLPVVAASLALATGPLWASLFATRRSLSGTTTAHLLWCAAIWAAIPLWFPEEREPALETALLALRGEDPGMPVLPRDTEDVPTVADTPEPDAAIASIPPRPPTEAPISDDHRISLPYEGEGRRLSVPVVFSHDGHEVETFMMLDTGATYTTLPREVLDLLGAAPGGDAPTLTLHTANGPRKSAVSLIDRVWIGDLPIDGVAITECEPCRSKDVDGLLGLNVTSGFNTTIDADVREVHFDRRRSHDRVVDVRPFADLRARVSRRPTGTVQIQFTLNNSAWLGIGSASARVTCDGEEWTLPIGSVGPGASETYRQTVPAHEPCGRYRVQLAGAAWDIPD